MRACQVPCSGLARVVPVIKLQHARLLASNCHTHGATRVCATAVVSEPGRGVSYRVNSRPVAEAPHIWVCATVVASEPVVHVCMRAKVMVGVSATVRAPKHTTPRHAPLPQPLAAPSFLGHHIDLVRHSPPDAPLLGWYTYTGGDGQRSVVAHAHMLLPLILRARALAAGGAALVGAGVKRAAAVVLAPGLVEMIRRCTHLGAAQHAAPATRHRREPDGDPQPCPAKRGHSGERRYIHVCIHIYGMYRWGHILLVQMQPMRSSDARIEWGVRAQGLPQCGARQVPGQRLLPRSRNERLVVQTPPWKTQSELSRHLRSSATASASSLNSHGGV